MSSFDIARKNMVDCQIHTAGVSIPAVLHAYETVPRELFVPKALQNVAYMDEELDLGEGRTLLAPEIHARMVEALAPKDTDVVLDIGGVTGYSAAIFSSLVSTVIVLEDKKAFLTQGEKVWNEIGACNIVSFQGALTQGHPENAPFDLIFMSGAVAEIPEDLVGQLQEGGRLICILKDPGATMGRVTLIENLGEKGFSSYTLFEAAAAYLPGFAPEPAFVF